MSEADRKRLDHVVLPRRLAGLPFLERYFPSPADNLIDAELAAFASPGDTVLDPWAGTGWTVRRGVAHGLRVVAADASPFAQLAAQAFLFAPDAASIDAAFHQLAASRRVDVPLRQHIEELYATRCATCRHPVVGEQFIWPRDAAAPQRKVYHCSSCDAALGGAGAGERVAEVDEIDLAKLGLGPGASGDAAPAGADAVPAPPLHAASLGPDHDPGAPIGEPGGPPSPSPAAAAPSPVGPRWHSTVHPAPAASPAASEPRAGIYNEQLRARFPVLDGRHELVAEILALYTPRNLYALQTIANKIDAEFRDQPMGIVMRLALAACLLPGSRLNGYPGRVASLRISGGHVRQPASRNQREVNVWNLFSDAVRDVRDALAPYAGAPQPARFAAEFDELGGFPNANALWIRCRPAVVGQYLPGESVDLVLGSAALPAGVDELGFEYLATAWLMGREAAETLRLEPLFNGSPLHDEAADAAALRHAFASTAGALKPGGWFNVLIDGDEPDRMLNAGLAGAAAGLRLVDVIVRESRRSGDGIVLHFRKPSPEDRLREAVQPRPLRLGSSGDRLGYPELAEAAERAFVSLLRDRGEPAGLLRLTGAALVELERSGLLVRAAHTRGEPAGEVRSGDEEDEGAPRAGTSFIGRLLREELARDDHTAVVQVGEADRPLWWLRDPELAEAPLADRVEWTAFSILSTAGRLDEDAFLERIYARFPGLEAPDEELVRACVAAYSTVDEQGRLRSEEELPERQAERARTLALLADYGHRLGLRVWISRREQERLHDGVPLAERLTAEERRVYLPLVLRAPADLLGAVDLLWYLRGKLAFLFEVEWTAMVGEPILRRGRGIEPTEQQARFLVLPGERAELLRLKLDRSPWLRSEMERQNWHVLKWQHLETLVRREGAELGWLEPVLGLDPLIERGGDQLTMFGE